MKGDKLEQTEITGPNQKTTFAKLRKTEMKKLMRQKKKLL